MSSKKEKCDISYFEITFSPVCLSTDDQIVVSHFLRCESETETNPAFRFYINFKIQLVGISIVSPWHIKISIVKRYSGS